MSLSFVFFLVFSFRNFIFLSIILKHFRSSQNKFSMNKETSNYIFHYTSICMICQTSGCFSVAISHATSIYIFTRASDLFKAFFSKYYPQHNGKLVIGGYSNDDLIWHSYVDYPLRVHTNWSRKILVCINSECNSY